MNNSAPHSFSCAVPDELVQTIVALQHAKSCFPNISDITDVLCQSKSSLGRNGVTQTARDLQDLFENSNNDLDEIINLNRSYLLDHFEQVLHHAKTSPDAAIDYRTWSFALKQTQSISQAQELVFRHVPPNEQWLDFLSLHKDWDKSWSSWLRVWEQDPKQAQLWLPSVFQSPPNDPASLSPHVTHVGTSDAPSVQAYQQSALSEVLDCSIIRSITHPEDIRGEWSHAEWADQFKACGALVDWSKMNIAPLFKKTDGDLMDTPLAVGQKLYQLWSQDWESTSVLMGVNANDMQTKSRFGKNALNWSQEAFGALTVLATDGNMNGPSLLNVMKKIDSADPFSRETGSWQQMLVDVSKKLLDVGLSATCASTPSRKM